MSYDHTHDPRPPGDTDGRDVELLARYVVAAATPEERAAVERRLLDDPSLQRELELVRRVWEQSSDAFRAEVSEKEVDAGWARLVHALDGSGAQPDRRSTANGPSTTWFRGRAHSASRRALLAASIVIALAAGALWRAAAERDTGSTAAVVAHREYVAGQARPTVVTFGDGSRAVLAPGSRLRAPLRFEGEARDVTLRGRGYFIVSRDPARPFSVRAGGVVTRVLGTEFEVRAYGDGEETRVTVGSGRVAVRSESAPAGEARQLAAGDRGTLAGGVIQVESGIDVASLAAWTQGTLDFRAMPLKDVVVEVERWFHVEIAISDAALRDRRLTATFRDEDLDVVLRTLATLANAQVRRAGRRVEFSSPQ